MQSLNAFNFNSLMSLLGKPKSVSGCSCLQTSLPRAAEGCHGVLVFCWTEAGRTRPMGTPGLHLQRSSACYPEDKLSGVDANLAATLLAWAHSIVRPGGTAGLEAKAHTGSCCPQPHIYPLLGRNGISHKGRVHPWWATPAFASSCSSAGAVFCGKARGED